MKHDIKDRRSGERFVVSFPIRVRWKNDEGKEVIQDGLTDNVGLQGTLVYLPRHLPNVGSKVNLTITEDPTDELTVTAQVIRLERNAAHPQAALQLLDSIRVWKKKVWENARSRIAALEPEGFDDW